MVAEKYIKLDDLIPAVKALSKDSSIRIPVVDAVEVRYGIWTDNGKNMYGQNLTQCSVCHSNSIEGGRFCRCCGALMKN
jgi:hypothetical protein